MPGNPGEPVNGKHSRLTSYFVPQLMTPTPNFSEAQATLNNIRPNCLCLSSALTSRKRNATPDGGITVECYAEPSPANLLVTSDLSTQVEGESCNGLWTAPERKKTPLPPKQLCLSLPRVLLSMGQGSTGHPGPHQLEDSCPCGSRRPGYLAELAESRRQRPRGTGSRW